MNSVSELYVQRFCVCVYIYIKWRCINCICNICRGCINGNRKEKVEVVLIGLRDFEQHGSSSLTRRNVCRMQCGVRHMSPALKQCKCVSNKRTPRLKGDEEWRNEFMNIVHRRQECSTIAWISFRKKWGKRGCLENSLNDTLSVRGLT
jgi:hypothetical protein